MRLQRSSGREWDVRNFLRVGPVVLAGLRKVHLADITENMSVSWRTIGSGCENTDITLRSSSAWDLRFAELSIYGTACVRNSSRQTSFAARVAIQ